MASWPCAQTQHPSLAHTPRPPTDLHHAWRREYTPTTLILGQSHCPGQGSPSRPPQPRPPVRPVPRTLSHKPSPRALAHPLGQKTEGPGPWNPQVPACPCDPVESAALGLSSVCLSCPPSSRPWGSRGRSPGMSRGTGVLEVVLMSGHPAASQPGWWGTPSPGVHLAAPRPGPTKGSGRPEPTLYLTLHGASAGPWLRPARALRPAWQITPAVPSAPPFKTNRTKHTKKKAPRDFPSRFARTFPPHDVPCRLAECVSAPCAAATA